MAACIPVAFENVRVWAALTHSSPLLRVGSWGFVHLQP